MRLQDRASLAALNRRLAAWIEGEYHHAPHCGLGGETPLDRLARVSDNVRYAGPDIDLGWIFSYRFVRRVSRARTVNLHGRQYETVVGLAGQKVTLVVEPDAPPEAGPGGPARGRRDQPGDPGRFGGPRPRTTQSAAH